MHVLGGGPALYLEDSLAPIRPPMSAKAAAADAQAERLSKMQGEPGAEVEAEPEAEPAIFTVEILRIVKEAQSQNGLRHSDYQRYRQYCSRCGHESSTLHISASPPRAAPQIPRAGWLGEPTTCDASRRLHRLRRALNFKHGKKRYVKRELDVDAVTDERFLHIPLVNAERGWSYAMQLKDEMVDFPRKKHHMIQRMSKAASSAYELQKLCNARADPRTRLEAEAYAAYMLGNVLLEREKWTSGQKAFVRAQTAYSELARQETGDMEYQRMYSNMSDELTPSIMYCRYNARKHGAGGDDEGDDAALKQLLESGQENPALELLKSKLEGVTEGARAAEAQALKHVPFRGAQLPVSNDKLRMAIITARDELKEVSKEKGLDKKMDRFGRVSVAYDDAVTIVSRELQKLRSDGGDADGVSNLQQMEVYLNFCREQAEVDRNLVLAESYRRRLAINGARQEPGESEEGGKTTKPDELVGIYEKLINVMSDMLELPGVDDNEVESSFYSARLLTFKALRCMYMGEAFRAQNSWPQAYVLYERAAQLANAAIKRHTGDAAPQDESMATVQSADVERLKAATTRIDGLRPLVHAEALLQSKKLTEPPHKERTGTLVDAVESYARPSNLAPFPPHFQPVPCKPILFDLVDREFEFPMAALEAKGQQKSAWGWGLGARVASGIFGS